jgi:predicted amidohydrolase YtcJ
VAQAAEGEWVKGYFLRVGDRLPNRYDLDPVSPHNPVFLVQQGGHYGSANSLALEKAGVAADTPDPTGGVIERDADGEPTGVFYNHRAMDVLRRHIPLPTPEMARDNISYAQPIFAACGVTTFHDNNVRGVDTVSAYFDTDREGGTLLRGQVHYTLEWPGDLERALSEVEYYEREEVGKLADLVVWSEDPYTAPLQRLWQIPVEMTLVEGEVIYQSGDTSLLPRRAGDLWA